MTSPFLQPPPRPVHLALPCAAVGLAGGWMIADFFRAGALHVDAGLRPALAAITPVLALALGLSLAPALRWPRWKALLAAVIAVPSAGLTGGALVGVLTWSHYGLADGAASGLWCAIAFLPAFLAVLAAARRIGRAREGSLLHAADRRAVWLAAATAIALGTLAAIPEWTIFPGALPGGARPSLAVSRGLGLSAVAAIACILVRDLAGLLRARRAAAELETMRPCDPYSPELPWAGERLDLGIGERAAVHAIPSTGPYRATDRIVKVIRGDAAAANRALAWSVARGAVALAVAGVVTFATAAAHRGPDGTQARSIVAERANARY